MWTFITQLLVTLVLLGFFLVSCQNVMHIVKGSLCFVLKHIHQELDKELGESEGVSDDEETISTRVVRRRVFLKVTTRQEAGLRARHCHVRGQQLGGGAGPHVRDWALPQERVWVWILHSPLRRGCTGGSAPGLGRPHSRPQCLWKGFLHRKVLSKSKLGASLPASGPPL